MEWTPKLSLYRQKVETDIVKWRENEIPKNLPLSTRRRVFKRKYPTKIKEIVRKYEGRLESEEMDFLCKMMMVKYKTFYQEIDSVHQKLTSKRVKK
jgi:hypothetical protein